MPLSTATLSSLNGTSPMAATSANEAGSQDRFLKLLVTQLMGETGNDPTAAGVRVSTIAEDQTPGRRVHDPKHPAADAEGYVTYSNVNAIEEMVNMISASRSYQNNVEVMNTAKSLLLKTLQMGQSS